MKRITLALAAMACLAFAAAPAVAANDVSNSRLNGDVKSGMKSQRLAQTTQDTTKKKDDSNTQDQTKRKSWGGGG